MIRRFLVCIEEKCIQYRSDFYNNILFFAKTVIIDNCKPDRIVI